MNQLNAMGIFSNNPIDSNDSPPGKVHLCMKMLVVVMISFSGNNQQTCAVYNYPAGCIRSDGSTTPGATALY